MAIDLTSNQNLASELQVKEPNIVAQIEGVDTIFGTVSVKSSVRIGDENLEIGDPDINENAFFIGGFKDTLNQKRLIDLRTTSKNIRQTLNQDLGEGTSISSFTLGLIDDGTLIDLITPGGTVPDLLGRKVIIWYSLDVNNTSFPDDYNVVFRGIITEIVPGPGNVSLKINHPDNKKKKKIFKVAENELVGDITDVATTLTLESTNDFLIGKLGPDGLLSTNFESYVIIDDEVIRYNGISGNQLTGLVRGQFGTTPASHDDNVQVSSRYRLKGNVIDLTLQLLASGIDGAYVENVEVDKVNVITSTNIVPNALFFRRLDFDVQFGLTRGDYVTTSGSAIPANNVTLRQVTDIVESADGFYVVVDGVSFENEIDTTMVAAFTSEYNVLPDGFGFTNDEIDVLEHQRLFRLFLSSFEYDFLLEDEIDGIEFVEKQLYSPIACYSLPRKSRASVGYHIGPIPGQNIRTFSKSNVLNPDKIQIKRSTTRNFYNEIIYKYDPAVLEDKFTRGQITISENSKNQIVGGAKTLEIESLGLRENLAGALISNSQSLRRLERYQFAAETLQVQTFFGDGYPVEIGDIVVFDGTELQVADIKEGKRGLEPRLFEVQNRAINLQGTVTLDLIDTSFDDSARRGLISPSSNIRSALNESTFTIEQSFSSRFASDEYRKWQNLTDPAVIVRSRDSSISEVTIIRAVNFNTITVDALSFVPTSGMILEFAPYDDPNYTTQQKLIYVSMRDTDFADGGATYKML